MGQRVPQVVNHVPGGGVSVRRAFRQGLQADALQLAGDAVVDLPERTDIDRLDLVEQP